MRAVILPPALKAPTMSLHPHIPHQIKQFGEHLFATFLGLLMALALEQWRELRHERFLARQALEGVRAELQANAKMLSENQQIAEATSGYWAESLAYMEDLVAARVEKREVKAPAPQVPKQLGAELNFRTGAWDSAKAMGALRHLSAKDLQDLTETYAALGRIQNMQDQSLVQVLGIEYKPWAQQQVYQALSIDQLYQAAQGLRAVANLKRFTAGVHKELAPQLEKAAKDLQLP